MNLDFVFSQIAQFDKSIYLFCLVFSALNFLLVVFFEQLTQYCLYIVYSTAYLGFLIYSFISLCCFNETNSLRLMYESTKALEIKTLIASNFVFASDAILSCFFLFFLIISLYLLNPAVIAHIFNPTAELVIPTGEMKRRRCSNLFRFLHIFLWFSIIASLFYFLYDISSCFIYVLF